MPSAEESGAASPAPRPPLQPAFSAVVMAYDEVESLEAVVRELEAALQRIGDPHEILVVDDGSDDGTGDLADRLAEELPQVRVAHHPRNLGLGGVYRTGFSRARGRFVTFYPADGQFPATILERMAPLMQTHDLVLGYLPGGRKSWRGRFLSWAERFLYRVLLGRLPRFQGVFMFRRHLLERFELRSSGRGWAVVMELILKSVRSGCRHTSIPTEIRPRLHGHSKVNNFRAIWSNLLQLVQLRRTVSRGRQVS